VTYGIVANVISDRVLRTGAKVWIHYVNGDAANPYVSGVSKGGRLVGKYIPFKRLTNFRSAWVPPNLRERVMRQWENRADAEQIAATLAMMWTGVQFFHRDGTLLQAGVTEGAAFERLGARA
jgi:hypothetical protein